MVRNDQLNHDIVLRDLRDSMSGITVPEPPHLNAVIARGRARRRRRLHTMTGLSIAGLAAGAALVLALAGVLSPATVRSLSTIRTAAFAIVGHPDGTASLTINAGEAFDPAALQADLAKYGIPALVNSGSFCSSDPAPDGFSQVVTFQPPFQGDSDYKNLSNPTITINPAALPDGTELSFGTFPIASGEQTAIALITTSSYACTSTMPTTLPASGALLRWPSQPGS